MATTYKVGNKRYTLSEMRANPRLRGKLPARLLTPAQQQMRKTNTANNAKAAPGSDYTTKALNDLLASQFKSADTALATRKTEIPTWFNQYRTQLSGFQTDQANRTKALQDATTAFAAQAAQNSKTGAQSGTSTAPGQTGPVDPQAAAREQMAENVRQSMIGSYHGMAGQLGANQQSALTGAQTQSWGLQSNAENDLLKLVTALQEQKTKAREDILSSEQKTKMENAVFKLNAGDKAFDNTTSRLALKERERNNLANQADKAERLALAKQKAKAKPKKPKLPQGQQNTFKSKIDQAVAVARDQAGGRKDAKTRAEVKQILLNGSPAVTQVKDGKRVSFPAIKRMDPYLAGIALNVLFDGGKISKANLKALKDRGIDVKKLGYRY
jgi:hypothetical protein